MKQDPLAGWLLSVWLGLAGESAGVRPATCRLQGGGGGRKGDLQPREQLHMPGAEKPLTLTRASADPPTARTRPERPPLIPSGAGMGRVGIQLCSCRWPQKRWPTRLARVHRGTQARCVLGEPVAGYRKRLEGRGATLEPQPLFLPGLTVGEPSVCLSLARCLPQPILQPVLFVRLPQPVLLPD